jgi:hypothetical protein
MSCAAIDARAQLTLQPTPPPTTSAETEEWYQNGEPLEYAGDLYYPAGAQIHFNRNEMIATGSYEGVPLYTRPTMEPFSVVYVPLTGGLMQPFERRRAGALAGTAGSTAPSFPVASPAEVRAGVTATSAVGQTPAQALVPPPGLSQRPGAARRLSPAPDATDQTTALPRAREATNGIFVEFRDALWFSSGPAQLFDARSLRRVGDIRGLPVYMAPDAPSTIFVAVTSEGDLVAPYSRRGK